MEKNVYERLQIEVITFECEDVIVTSEFDGDRD